MFWDTEKKEEVDWEKYREDLFVGPLVEELDRLFKSEAAYAYAVYDASHNYLVLYFAGSVTVVPFNIEHEITRVESDAMGPIDIVWGDGLEPVLLAPLIIMSEESGVAFRMPLHARQAVTDRMMSQGSIKALSITEKMQWYNDMQAIAADFPDTFSFSGDTRDVMLTGLQATMTYPRSAYANVSSTNLNAHVDLDHNIRVNISALPPAQALERLAVVRSEYLALPDDDRVILHDAEGIFSAVAFDESIYVAKLVEIEHLTYLVTAYAYEQKGLEEVLAIAGSLAQRPLSAPEVDLAELTRDQVLTMLGLPPLELGRSWDPNVRKYMINNLAALFLPANLMARYNMGSRIADDEVKAFEANYDEADGRPYEYTGNILCVPFLDRPELASEFHEVSQAQWQDTRLLNRPRDLGFNYIESGDFAAGKEFSSSGDSIVPRSEVIWFLDTPDMAIGTEGPLYYLYKVEQIGPFTLACKTQSFDALRAWLTMNLYGDVPRPESVSLTGSVREHFRAYDQVRGFNQGLYLVSEKGDLRASLASNEGNILIPEPLMWWSWDNMTQTISAKNDDDKAGLYLPNGTQLLSHLYEEIRGTGQLGSEIIRVKDEDREYQYFHIETRTFVPEPTD